MAKPEVFISAVRGGKLSKQTKEGLAHQIMKCEGGRVIITIAKFSSRRSLPQNKYQHLLYTIFRDALNELGNDFSMEEIKELCKFKFLTVDVTNEDTGEVLGKRIKGTSELTKVETMEYLDAVIAWAKEDFNIKLPLPNEALQIDF